MTDELSPRWIHHSEVVGYMYDLLSKRLVPCLYPVIVERLESGGLHVQSPLEMRCDGDAKLWVFKEWLCSDDEMICRWVVYLLLLARDLIPFYNARIELRFVFIFSSRLVSSRLVSEH